MNLSNPSGNWLISIYVIKTIETEWVQCQNKHWQQISKADTSNYTKTIIYLTLTEYYTMILTSVMYEGSLKETLNKVNLDMLIAIKY